MEDWNSQVGIEEAVQLSIVCRTGKVPKSISSYQHQSPDHVQPALGPRSPQLALALALPSTPGVDMPPLLRSKPAPSQSVHSITMAIPIPNPPPTPPTSPPNLLLHVLCRHLFSSRTLYELAALISRCTGGSPPPVGSWRLGGLQQIVEALAGAEGLPDDVSQQVLQAQNMVNEMVCVSCVGDEE
ncbi:hypothetical protein EDC01DRAFT_763424 [Geopyxis carbonaria]|nr:hypothetical protein EDC01DRAFT_763424 [Geopyxis carbonaria]